MNLIPTNDQRAGRCQRVLSRYGTDDTAGGSLIDLLADARHWCDRHGRGFAELDRIAYRHYAAEVAEEQPPREGD